MKKHNGKLETIESLLRAHDVLVKLMAKEMDQQEKDIREMGAWVKKHESHHRRHAKLHRLLEQRLRLHYHLIDQLR